MDQNPKQQVAEKLRSSANVLVTVSKNPSVDQLAAAIGLSLMLDALGKHTATVFSGQIPDILKFLEPEKTFDSNVDGLRDFIISLDKDKADKLRYKVDGDLVKVYITPYKSKITEQDLTFTQGDFNVDVVIALGVKKKADLDEAIVAHGRILHDATIVAVNAGEVGGDVGSIDWTDVNANSLCEMLVSISEALEGGVLDAGMSTAFLTGIVSVTERFSNDKTTPKLMTMAAQLMAAGANQQLISKELQLGDGFSPASLKPNKPKNDEDGTTIDLHEPKPKKETDKSENSEIAKEKIDEIKENATDLKLDELEEQLKNASEEVGSKESEPEEPEFIEEKLDLPIMKSKSEGGPLNDIPLNPSLGGTFNATSEEALQAKANEQKDGFNDEILSHSVDPLGVAPEPFHPPEPDSPDLNYGLDEARRAVEQAALQSPYNPAGNPVASLNAQPMTSDVAQQLYHENVMPPAPGQPQLQPQQIMPQQPQQAVAPPPAVPPPMPPTMNIPQQPVDLPPQPQSFNPVNDMGGAQTFSIPGQPQVPQMPQAPQQTQWPTQSQAPQQQPWPPQQEMQQPPPPTDMSGLPPPPPPQ